MVVVLDDPTCVVVYIDILDAQGARYCAILCPPSGKHLRSALYPSSQPVVYTYSFNRTCPTTERREAFKVKPGELTHGGQYKKILTRPKNPIR